MSNIISLYVTLESIAKEEFSDIVTSTEIMGKRSRGSSKLRVYLKDDTLIDIWLSASGKYS